MARSLQTHQVDRISSTTGEIAAPVVLVKGRVHIFFIRELDAPPLEESNLMGPKKSVEVKFFTVAFFAVHPMLSITHQV